MEKDIERLMSLKKKIEESQKKVSEYQGMLKSLRQRLKDEFDIDSVAAAKKKLADMEAELISRQSFLKKNIEEICEKYNGLLQRAV